jgi:uncharacterized protein YbbK (DUF523 family)
LEGHIASERQLRPRVGVSSCLLGERVRWDGGESRDAFLTDVLGPAIEWVPLCPEMAIGLGVPREPIQLLRRPAGFDLVTVETQRDLTGTMNEWAARTVHDLDDLDGYVLKSRSPSCGLAGARVFETEAAWRENGAYSRAGRGLFADALVRRHPLLAAVEETDLEPTAPREHFVERAFASCRLRRALAEASLRERIDFAGRHALQLRTRSALAMREVAGAVNDPERFRIAFLRAMAGPPTEEGRRAAFGAAVERLEDRSEAGSDGARAVAAARATLDGEGDGVRAAVARAAEAAQDVHLLRQTLLFPDEGERLGAASGGAR